MEWRYVGSAGEWLVMWNNDTQCYHAFKATPDDGVMAGSVSEIWEKVKQREAAEKANKEMGGKGNV